MRLWSLHPRYLDTKGFVALWKEGLQARRIIRSEVVPFSEKLKSNGYRNHPQLDRFKTEWRPLRAIDYFLWIVYKDSLRRGYNFNRELIPKGIHRSRGIPVSRGQLAYETEHLRKKLTHRAPELLSELPKLAEPHPLFILCEGSSVEPWERIK